MNNNININNKPLKCVITNNESAIKYFSSMPGKEPYAGTLIVVDKSNGIEPNGYKKIYLNEKFLAGGYGFGEEKYIKLLEDIANEYAQTIGRIDDEENTNTTKLRELIDTKLDKEGPKADASNVYFLYQDARTTHQLYIKDIIELLSKIPQYKDLEIISIKLKASYIDYKSVEQQINDIDFKDINDFTLPINVKLKSIRGIITINTNHTKGLSNIEINYKKHNSDTDFYSIQYRVNPNISDTILCEFNISFETNDPYIISENNSIIGRILLDVVGTPSEKYQSVLIGESGNEKNIIYTANIIPDYQKSIDFPNIKGDYYLTYDTSISGVTDLTLNSDNLFGNKNIEKIISNNDNKNKFTYINLDIYTSKIVLLLPYRYTIRQAYLVNGSDEISITNFLNYFPYNGADNFIQNNLRSNLYYINISNHLNNVYQLKLDIVEDDSITYELMNNTNENITNNNVISFLNTELTHVLNSDEIHKYWVNNNNIDNLDLIFNYDKL